MERPVRTDFNTQIHEEACEWFIECRSGDLDAAARVKFDAWLRKSPEHQSAYLEMAAIWNEGPTLDSGNRWSVDTLIAQAAEDSGIVIVLDRTSPLTCTTANVSSTAALASGERYSPAPPRHGAYAAAASIFLALALFTVYKIVPGDYSTVVGEQRAIALKDGSTVELNSLSEVRVHYTEHERTIELLRGQALFRVAKDSTRPFLVYSGPTRVMAIGTQFDVYRKPTATIVTVVEGRVAVSSPPFPGTLQSGSSVPLRNNPPPALKAGKVTTNSAQTEARATGDDNIYLAAGEQVTVSPQVVHKTQHPNLAEATAWTQRQLVFDSASLAEVADQFNRYNERKLIIDPTALGELHISGVFSSTDPTTLIRFLRDRPGVRVVESSRDIRVEKAN